MGTEDGRYPAMGWHITGEMGGFWTPPMKMLDGMWFGINGSWLPQATSFTSGWGYTRMTVPTGNSGLTLRRTDFVPDGIRGALVGLTFSAPQGRQRFTLDVDAHSELMSSYPWGWTTPDAGTFNLPDTASYDGRALVFRERGTPPVPNATSHDWAALVASDVTPVAGTTGGGFRGPQEPPVVCPTSGTTPDRCDDSGYGKGAGGRLTYLLDLAPKTTKTVWYAVGGSDRGLADARGQLGAALAAPQSLLSAKREQRAALAARTVVDLPGDRLLQKSVEWSKQNLADSVQEARQLRLREVNEGRDYPPPDGVLRRARWFGAGFPDYPWLFGTDGEYTAFAAVAAGQFSAIKDHLRALRDASDIVNDRSGKVVHEVMQEGSVYFGTNSSPGNTDETAKFPSAVALVWRWTGESGFLNEMYDFTKRNMHFIYETLDADGDGWPEGLGNVERAGMGEEKLDNTVYTIRGLRDLADMAKSKNDAATVTWANSRAADLESRFEEAWWYDRTADQYGDSLDDPGDVKVFQRHWIGVTPMEAELVRPGQPGSALATRDHAVAAIEKRQEDCYSGTFGLYHTGTGPTSADGGNRGPSCESEISTVQSERSIFSLNTAIMAVGEGNYGRMAVDEQQRYTTGNARIQLDPSVWEMPGAMPEIAPSPDFTANIDRKLTDRSMVLQAWGTYGILWPVVHQQLGVRPDLGHGLLEVVPQVPEGQTRVAGRNIRLGSRSVDVVATRTEHALTTRVTRHGSVGLTIGHLLPAGAQVARVTLDGVPVAYTTCATSRGRDVVVPAGMGKGVSRLVVALT